MVDVDPEDGEEVDVDSSGSVVKRVDSVVVCKDVDGTVVDKTIEELLEKLSLESL